MAFVSYDSYKNRIEKLAKVKNFVSKYKFLFIGVFAVIIGGISALLATKGMITTDMSLSSSTYTYGDDVALSAASSFLSDVGYEYTVQGKDEWTSEKPRKVGKYSVRAVTDKVAGKGYGKPVDFEILPKPVNFVFGDEASLRYGDKPVNYNISDLIAGDRIDISGAAFDYVYHDQADDVNEWTVDVTVGAGSVKIVDKNGNDFSDCYIYDTAEKTFALTRRPISVVLQNSSDTYRGAEISYKGELFTPDLAEGDDITFETEITQNGAPATLLNAGVYGLSVKENSVKIFKGSENVTKRYDIGTPVSGRFTVNKKTLSISTQSGNKTYDGTALSKEGGTPDGLILGHTLSPTGTVPSITDVGTVRNEQTFDILDGRGENVSDNYDYKNNYQYGNLTVTRRALTITTAGGEWEYDGSAHPVKTHNASGLAEGQELANISYSSEWLTDVNDSGENTLNYSIVWGQSGAQVDLNNYEITENYGYIKITARPLKVTTDGATRTYNGTPLTVETYTVTYAGEKAGQTDAFIYEYENLSYNPDALPKIINVGTKENAINFTVPNNNYYIDQTKTVYGTLEVTPAEITVTLNDVDDVVYGDELPEPAYTVSGEGIVGGNLFSGDTFQPAFKYQNGLSPTSYEAGKVYEVSLDTADCAFTYGHSEPATQPNYTINSNKSNLTVVKRAITVYLNDTPAIYGNSVIYDNGNEAVDNIVSGQTVQVDALQVNFDIPSNMPDARAYYGVISCLASAIKIYDGSKEVTSNYTVTVQNSTLTVTPRPITVHANDMSGIIYGEDIDYTAVHSGGYKSITGDGLATSETLTVNRVSYLNVNGETVDPNDNPDKGAYKIKPSSVTIKKANGDDSTGNYDITAADDGVLTVIARPVTIQSATDLEMIYDGTAQFNKGNVVTSELKPVEGHRIDVVQYKTVTDVSEGTVINELKYIIKDSFNKDVTENYAIEDDFGTLKVNPRPITVQLNTYSATYGDEYSYAKGEGNYANDPDLVTGETLEVLNVTYGFGTLQYPDASETAYWVRANANAFKVTKAGGTTDSTANYEITPVDGSLEITKRDITVQLISYSATYGESYAYKTGAGNYANIPDLVTGERLEITAVSYEFGNDVQYPEVNDGGYGVSQTGYTITKNGADGKGNYNVEWEDGTLTITKRTITVTLNDIATVTYGEAVNYIIGGEKVENTIGVCTVDFDTDNLEFIPADDVSVGTRNDIIDGATYTYPDAGAYKFGCDGKDIAVYKDGANVSHNYTVNVVSGRLQINKREITVKAHSYSREYGDDFNYSSLNLTPNYEKLTKGSLAVFDGEEETLAISVLSLEFDGGVHWDVGTYPVHPDGYTVTKVDGTTDSSKNYKVEFEDGTLEITKKQIKAELKDIKLTYGEDGVKDDQGKTKTYAELYAEEIEEVEIAPAEMLKLTFGFTDEDGNPVDPHNAGDYGVVITNGETKNYKIEPKGEVKLTINTRQIHPVPYFKTEVYGTTEFNYPSVAANASTNYDDEFKEYYYCLPAYDEKIEISVGYDLGSQELPSVGTYDAVCTGARVLYSDGSFEDGELTLTNCCLVLTQNYQIFCESYNFAEKLKIIPCEVTITLNDIEAEYGDEIKYESDGTEKAEGLLTKFGHELKIDPNGVDFEEQGDAIYPNVGKYSIVTSDTDFITIFSGEDEVTQNYDIKVASGGTLTIVARKIVLNLEDMEDIVYGTKAPVPTITGTIPGDTVTNGFIYDNIDTSSSFDSEWLNGGENRYLTAGTYHVALSSGIITFEYANGAPASTRNYDVQAVLYANLKVAKRHIDITLIPFEREYGQNNSDSLTWQKKGTSTGLSYISDMNINELVSIENLAEGEGVYSLTLSVYAEGTEDVVECKNAVTYNIGLKSLYMHYANETSQYTENYEYDLPARTTLEITKYKLSPLNVGEKKALYGSAASTLEWWEYSRTGLPFGEVVKVSSFALKDVNLQETTADVGTYDLDPEYFTAKVEGGSADNYEITISGTLKIEQREITVNLHDNEVYYGEPYDYLTLTGGTYIGVAGLVSVDGQTETLEITAVDYGFDEGAFPNASSTPYTVKDLECKITKVDGTTDSTNNYSIKWMGGNLTVNKRPVTVTLQPVDDIIYGQDLPIPECVVEGAEGLVGGLVGSDKFHPAFGWTNSGDHTYYPYNYGEYIDGNVGKYGIILHKQQSKFTDAKGNEIDNYEIVSNSAANEVTLNITPRPVTITLNDFTLSYGEINQTFIRWDAGVTTPTNSNVIGDSSVYLEIGGEYGLAKNEEIKQFILQTVDSETGNTESIVNAGTYNLKAVLIAVSRADGSIDYLRTPVIGGKSNYEIVNDDTATLTINPKKVDIDLGDYNFTYGEEEEFRDGFTFTSKAGDLAFDETLTLKTFYAGKDGEPIAERLDAGEYEISANQSAAVFSDDCGQDNYEVTFTGTLTVNKRTVEIELWDIESVTYGERLAYPEELNNFDRLKGEFVYGQQFKVMVLWNGSYICTDNTWGGNAGTYVYNYSKGFSSVYESDGETYANKDNYSISCADKEATINPFEVEITPDSYTKTYDGEKYVCDSTSFSLDKDLPYEESLKISVIYKDKDGNTFTEPKDAGTYYIYLDEITEVNRGKNADAVVENYLPINVDTVYGTLEISKRDIKVGVVENQKFVYGVEEVSPKFTGIGFPQDGVDAGNVYAIPGGWEYSVDKEEWLDGNDLLLNGITLGTGVYYVRCTYAIVTYDKGVHYDPIGKNHEVDYEVGTFEVIAREVRLVTNTHDFIYNGDYQYDTGYTLYYKNAAEEWTEFTLPVGETVILGEYAKIKNVGTVANEVDLTFPNYNVVETECGTLTVNRLEITIESATDHTFIYGGAAHSNDGFKVTSVNQLIGWHEIKVSNPATVTFVTEGEVENVLTYTIIDTKVDENDEDRNVTSNYKINKVNGTLKVNPRPIGLKSDDKEFTYNGDEQYWEGYTQLSGEGEYGLVDGHEISVVGNTTVLTVMQGEVENVLGYKIVDGSGNDVTENYKIIPTNGKLKVKPVLISITLNDLEVTYGDALYPDRLNNYDLDNSTPLVDGEQLKVAVKYKDAYNAILDSDPVDVGDYTILLDLAGCYVETPYGEDGFGNYTVVKADEVEAKLIIIHKEITLQLDPMTKQYGEDFVSSDTYQVVSGEIINDDKIEAYVYCPDGDIDGQTPVGPHTIEISHCKVNGIYYHDIIDTPTVKYAGSYKITFIGSTLTVIAREIVAVAASAEKEGYYDGTEFSCPEYGSAYSEDYDCGVMPWDSIDDILEYVEGSANSIINAGDFDNEAQFVSKSDNYQVVRTDPGTLTIKQRPITIELIQIDNQTYGTRLTYPDGTEEPNYVYAADSECELVSGENLFVAVKFKGSDGNVADPKNADTYSYVFDLEGSTVTDSVGGAGIDNYLIICTDIKYAKVNKLTVAVNLQPWTSVEYDGDYHEYDGGITTEFAYGETMELAVDYYLVIDGDKTPLDDFAPKDAGDYLAEYNEENSIIGGYAPNVNYEIIISPEDGISFTITPKNITITMNDERRVYNGKVYDYLTEYTVSKFVSQAVGGDKIIPAAVNYEDGVSKDVGTYIVNLEADGFDVEGGKKSNYVLLTETSKLYCEVEIFKRDITFTVEDWTIEVGEDVEPELTIGEYGFVEGEELTPAYFVKGEDDALIPIDGYDFVRGIYEIHVSYDDEDGVLANYNPEYYEGILEITARNVTVTPTYSGGNFIYDGNPISLDGFGYTHVRTKYPNEAGFTEGNVPEHKFVFTDRAGNRIESPAAPVNAGTYTFTVEFINVNEDDYLIFNDGSIEITVDPRPVTVTFGGYDESNLADYLTYNFSKLPEDLVTASVSNIVEGESSTVEWFYYNFDFAKYNLESGEVEYNYAGDYMLDARIINADGEVDGNYVIVEMDEITFAVNKAPLYVTPKNVNADYTYVGQTVALAGDDYELRLDTELYGSDTLEVTGSGVLKTARSMPVTIKSVLIMQGGYNVTECYDVHYKYEKDGKLTSSDYMATLSFNPVKIYYTQEVLDDAHRFFEYNGSAQDLGVDKNNLQNYINIINPEDFVGECSLRCVLETIYEVREYEQWITIIVYDSENTKVTKLYDFVLVNGDESKIVVKGYDLNLKLDLSDGDLADAWAKRDNASDNTLTASSLYDGYYVLNGGYTLTGFTDSVHNGEVLVKQDGEGNLIIKVIVFEQGAKVRMEKSKTYTLNVTATATCSITLSRMSQL